MKAVVCAAAMVLAATTTFAQADKAMPAKPMTKSAVADKLMANENKLLDAVKAKDMKTFSMLTAKDGWSVDENGYMSIADFVKAMSDPKTDFKVEMLKASDMKVVDINADSAIVTYTVDQKGSFMGMAFPPVTYATTIWANQGGTWHAVFHQESTAVAKK